MPAALWLILLALQFPVADSAALPPSPSDLWDASQGATVTSHSEVLGPPAYPSDYHSDIANMFGASLGTVEVGTMLFQDFLDAGTVHFVEWQTADSMTLRSFNLQAAHDQSSQGASARGFDLFRLLADTGSGFELIFSFTAGNPYSTTPTPPDSILEFSPDGRRLNLCANVDPVAASSFRAEFVQVGPPSVQSGPRIEELDGYEAGCPGRTGALRVTKTTDVGGGTFTFDIDCSDDSYDATGEEIAANGSREFPGIPVGTECTVTEDPHGDYHSSSVPGDGTVTIDEDGATVAFTNALKTADLALDKECADEQALPGTTVSCTLEVSNHGPDPAPATVADDLPAGMTLAGSPGGPGWECSGAAGNAGFECRIDSLAVESASSIAFSVTVPSGAGPGDVIANEASVTSGRPDPQPDNNADTFELSVPECTIAGEGTVVGTSGDDVLCATGPAVIYGLDGDDIIFAGGGETKAYGGAGDDTIVGSDFADLLHGQGGHDVLYGGDGPDHLYGQGDDDSLYGGGGDDYLAGGAGTDLGEGGPDSNTCVQVETGTC